jgi:hypothetical protein
MVNALSPLWCQRGSGDTLTPLLHEACTLMLFVRALERIASALVERTCWNLSQPFESKEVDPSTCAGVTTAKTYRCDPL